MNLIKYTYLPTTYMYLCIQSIYYIVCKYIGEGHGNPLQYSCLENPVDRRAWWATVHGVAKSQTRLSDLASAG